MTPKSNENLYHSAPVFDYYAGTYREVLNKANRLSGEDYEYFIELRISMMKQRLDKYCSETVFEQILDYGCGIGTTEIHMRKHFPQSRIFGFDTSPTSIAAASERALSGIEFSSGEGKELPYPDDSFDLIYMNGTMHHIPPEVRRSVLLELLRILKRGGFAFIYENNPCNPLMMHSMRINPVDRGVRAIWPREMARMGYENGFKVIEKWFYFFFPKALAFMRPLERKMEWLPIGAQYCVWLTK